MTDRPIIFSGPMIRAIAEGRKTQTRRVLNPQPEVASDGMIRFDEGGWFAPHLAAAAMEQAGLRLPCAVGDRLWVRETWCRFPATAPDGMGENVYYRSEGKNDSSSAADVMKRNGVQWRSPIHMPRWASRFVLTVTDVRVERLQDISEADAIAEGVERQDPTAEDWDWYRAWSEEHGLDPNAPDGVQPVWLAPGTRQGFGPRRNDPKWGPTPQFAFRLLWDSIHAKRPDRSWEANPFISAITFTVERRNIDQQ